MNVVALIFFIVSASALLAVPRKWAPVPLLVSCCFMTMGQGVELGPFSLPVYRMMLAVGLVRVLLRAERFAGGFNTIDKLMFAWALWVLIASLFHEWVPGSGPVFASGFVFNISLVYFLTRIWCHDLKGLMDVTRIVALLLSPIAVEMVTEHINDTNMFAMFGGVAKEVHVRDNTIRAQGPFQHPILAGTVGAVCFPLMIGIWRRHRRDAIIGIAACVVMVIASGSSGPVMSLLMGVLALVAWYYREWIRAAWLVGVGIYLVLELIMSRPAYYIISKFDLTGSSTGWHRSRLIEAAIEYFGEWWLFGTDRTIHWMGVTIGWSEQHSDITNYYILIGVIGGFPAMVLLIAMMWRAFRWVGRIVRTVPAELASERFMIWSLGAGLFAHATTGLSVAYFDQSVIFFWLNVAVISSMHSILTTTSPAAQPSRSPVPEIGSDGVAMARLRRGINDAWAGPLPAATSPRTRSWIGGRT